MASEYDLSIVGEKANMHLWESLQAAAFEAAPPTKEQVTQFAAEAVEMVLKVLVQEGTGVEPKASDHVKIIIDDLDGKMTKVGISFEAKTDHGQTILFVFGYGEPPAEEAN